MSKLRQWLISFKKLTVFATVIALVVTFGLTGGVSYAYAECSSTVWALKGDSGAKYYTDGHGNTIAILEAWLYVSVDSHDGSYCGGVYAKAKDAFVGGCYNYNLVVQYTSGSWVPGSYINPYHCTSGVVVTTPVVYPNPGHIQGYNWLNSSWNAATPSYTIPT